MGAWSAKLFDDDITLDVRYVFEDALLKDTNISAATREVLEKFENYLEDSEDGPLVYLALAALQLDRGMLQQDIRDKAIIILATGEAIGEWKDTSTKEERIKILDDLKNRLSSTKD